MEIETLKTANALMSQIDELNSYKESVMTDTGGDWFCDVKQLYPDIYNDLKVYIGMLFDTKVEEINKQFKAL